MKKCDNCKCYSDDGEDIDENGLCSWCRMIEQKEYLNE